MKACEICGPEESCSGCIHDQPVGFRAVLIDLLLDHYLLGRVNPTPKDEEDEEELRVWLTHASGWDTKPLSKLRKELEKFDKSPGH